MNDTERETPVIFTWADREGSSWWLAAFIFLSFLLHSSAFFLFQGKNPAAPRMVRTAPPVQFLSASDDPAARSPENDALLVEFCRKVGYDICFKKYRNAQLAARWLSIGLIVQPNNPVLLATLGEVQSGGKPATMQPPR